MTTFSPEKSVLLVVDVQGKLAHLMHEKEKLFHNIQALIRSAEHLAIPIIHTEQAPEKIGETIPEIADLLKGKEPFKKSTFSCCGDDKFMRTLKSLFRKQIIVVGIEAHVCVCQTVSDLLSRSFQVQVVADAVSSRTVENKQFALERMRDFDAVIASTEMIVTELLKDSRHPKFREILSLIR